MQYYDYVKATVQQTEQANTEIKKTPKHGLLSDMVTQLTLDQRKLKRTDNFKKQHKLSLDIHSWLITYGYLESRFINV